ncbi:uncharacterized protein UTRI_10376_B [Ustilago trichophora]|uniref:Uncharacterized protein n=1 Tax=Ustilago trichophora TaxID=86804 RepID=A0A5C3E849_9BASI|nr:uncharacterized protein UTRI_10376_B [Ustilago trichophora]
MFAVIKNRMACISLIAVLASTVSAYWRSKLYGTDKSMQGRVRTAQLELQREASGGKLPILEDMEIKHNYGAVWGFEDKAWSLAQHKGLRKFATVDRVKFPSWKQSLLGIKDKPRQTDYYVSIIRPGDTSPSNRKGYGADNLADHMGLRNEKMATLLWRNEPGTKKFKLVAVEEYPDLPNNLEEPLGKLIGELKKQEGGSEIKDMAKSLGEIGESLGESLRSIAPHVH